MKGNPGWFWADISFVLLLLLFICVLFFAVVPQYTALSIVAMGAVFAVMIVTRYTSLTVGLLMDIVLMLLYASYLLYQGVWLGTNLTVAHYFWLVILPPITLATDGIHSATRRALLENDALTQRVTQAVGWDVETGLRNRTAFDRDFPVFMRIAEGCDRGILLMVWQFRYEDELQRLLGEADLHEAVKQMTAAIDEKLGEADIMFQLDDNPYQWGALFVGGADMEAGVKQQIHEAEDAPLSLALREKMPRLEIRVGSAYAEPGEDPEALLKRAQANMQYDV